MDLFNSILRFLTGGFVSLFGSLHPLVSLTIASVLTGIGMSKAEKIVEYREQNGPFDHIDELVNVKGIGLRTVDKNRDAIVLHENTEPAE